MHSSIIFHIDVNSAFLSWSAVEMLKNGYELDIRTVPSVIGGNEQTRHGIVLAKSVSASKLGIKTGDPLFMAREKCPNLLVFPPDNNVYIEQSKNLRRLLDDYSPVIEQYSVDECFLDYTNMDYHFGSPLEGARIISQRIKDELGFTVNIGISSNKLLAKMAGDLSKPDKIHTLFPHEIKEKMWQLPVGDLFMVGKSTQKGLYEMGINTIGELAHTDIKLLKFKFHSHGVLIHNYANGIDHSSVIPYEEAPKSMGISQTTTKDITSLQDANKLLLALSETLSARLRKYGYTTGELAVSIRNQNRIDTSHQMRLDEQTQCTNTIYKAASKLFSKKWNGEPLRKLGVHARKLCSEEVYQPDFWNTAENDKWLKLDKSLDKIRNRFGKSSVNRLSIVENELGQNVKVQKVVAFAPSFSLE